MNVWKWIEAKYSAGWHWAVYAVRAFVADPAGVMRCLIGGAVHVVIRAVDIAVTLILMTGFVLFIVLPGMLLDSLFTRRRV